MRRALISTSEKRGLEEFARALHAHDVEIISTGATTEAIRGWGIPVTSVSSITQFEEILDGRVKTLHPAIHGGILADRSKPHHLDQIAELGVAPIDLVVVNLYPFEQSVAEGASFDESLEQIDIGGATLIRAGAKNFRNVLVVVSPDQYGSVINAIKSGDVSTQLRQELAAQAFQYIAAYDVAIANWVTKQSHPEGLPLWKGLTLRQRKQLRYGENPHQTAALYSDESNARGLSSAQLLHGKEMSFNNYVDVAAATRAVFDFAEPCVAIIKHSNPCGIAIGDSIENAYAKAHASDPLSAFGAVVASNRSVNRAMAQELTHVFTEVIAAPDFDSDAVEILKHKPSLRLLQIDPTIEKTEMRAIPGGLLVQTTDLIDAPGDHRDGWSLVSGEAADEKTLLDLEFAWRAVRSVKSNAIVLAVDVATVGIGMGQVNRVDAAKLAVARAGDRARNAVAASDAFFPFPDGLDVLIAAGVRAVIQPGGSVRDESVIAAAQAAGLTMYLTGVRHFAH